MNSSLENEGTVAELVLAYGQYVLSYPKHRLEVRGKYPEWVLMAAAEILGHLSKMNDANELDLKMFANDADDDPIEVEMETEFHRYYMEARYDAIPQCGVTYDGDDYRWVAEPGRVDDEEPIMERIIQPEMKARGSNGGQSVHTQQSVQHGGEQNDDAASSESSTGKKGSVDFDMAAEMAKLDNIPGLD